MSNLANKAMLRQLGKAQARQQFAPIVESLAANGGIVEITDYGKVAAVLLSHKDYLRLKAQAQAPFKPSRKLRGSGVLLGDLEETSKKMAKSVTKSVKRTISQI